MNLIRDWRETLNKAWSVRIAILMALLSVIDPLLPMLGGVMSPLAYAGLALVLVITRIAIQTNGLNDKPT